MSVGNHEDSDEADDAAADGVAGCDEDGEDGEEDDGLQEDDEDYETALVVKPLRNRDMVDADNFIEQVEAHVKSLTKHWPEGLWGPYLMHLRTAADNQDFATVFRCMLMDEVYEPYYRFGRKDAASAITAIMQNETARAVSKCSMKVTSLQNADRKRESVGLGGQKSVPDLSKEAFVNMIENVTSKVVDYFSANPFRECKNSRNSSGTNLALEVMALAKIDKSQAAAFTVALEFYGGKITLSSKARSSHLPRPPSGSLCLRTSLLCI
jgi:hypothetical protein